MSCSECSQKSAAAEAEAQEYPHKDCFMMSKVYDWVKLKTEMSTLVMIPDADLPAIRAAIEAGDDLDVSAYAVLSEVCATAALVERSSAYCACVQFRKKIPLHVTILDVTTGIVLSQFTKLVQEFDSSSLCFPEGMPESAIQVKIVGVEAYSLSTSPVDGAIAFLLSICQDIIVKLDVMVKLNVWGLCESRAGKNCIGSVPCDPGTPSYPAQCPSSTTCS